MERRYTPDKPAQNISWRNKLKLLIDKLIYKSENFDELLKKIEQSGYIVRAGNRKYISIKPSEGNCRACRLKTLGEDYTEEKLRERIANRDNFNMNTEHRLKNAAGLTRVCLEQASAVIVLIYSGAKQPRKWNERRCYSVENDYHINLITQQLQFIEKEKIIDEIDLQKRIDTQQATLDTLNKKIAEQSKNQINAKDLIARADFYFANADTKLDSMAQMKLSAARDLLTRYGITNTADVAKIRQVYAAGAAKLAEYKQQAATVAGRQTELIKVARTLAQVRDSDFTASVQTIKSVAVKRDTGIAK